MASGQELLRQAQELIRLRPKEPDTWQRIQALKAQAPREFQFYFDELGEALFHASGAKP